MNYFTSQRINKDLKSLVSQFKDGFRIKCDSSRNAYMKTLSPGAPMPLEGRIYGDGNVKSLSPSVWDIETKLGRSSEIISGI